MNDTVKNCCIVTDIFSFKVDCKRPTNPMPVPDMARAPSVAIPHKVDRSKPNLSKALRTLEKILAKKFFGFVQLLVLSFYKYSQLYRVLYIGALIDCEAS